MKGFFVCVKSFILDISGKNCWGNPLMEKILAKPKLGFVNKRLSLSSWKTVTSSGRGKVLFCIEKHNSEVLFSLPEDQSHLRRETESLSIFSTSCLLGL